MSEEELIERHGKDHIEEGLGSLKNINFQINNIQAFIRQIYENLPPEVIVRHTNYEEYGLDHILTGLIFLKSIDYDVELIIEFILEIYPDLGTYDPFDKKVKKK